MMSLMIMESGVTFKELEKKIYAWICQIGCVHRAKTTP